MTHALVAAAKSTSIAVEEMVDPAAGFPSTSFPRHGWLMQASVRSLHPVAVKLNRMKLMKLGTRTKAVIAAVALLAFITPSTFAAEKAAEKEVTLKGDGKCGKCALKETKECQNVVQVKEGDKTVTYYLVANDVSKKFHENLCEDTKKISVTGKVKEVDGKKQIEASKITLAKK